MDTKKIIQSLNYFADSQIDKSIDNMKAYKLLWLADRWHLRQYGRTISGDEYHALPFGVVPSDAKCILEQKATKLPNDIQTVNAYLQILPDHRFSSKKKPDMSVFSDTDREALSLILAHFNQYDSLQLSEISHKFPEWMKYEQRIKDQRQKNGYKINMDYFFENHKESSNLFNDPQDLLDLTKEIYHQYRGS